MMNTKVYKLGLVILLVLNVGIGLAIPTASFASDCRNSINIYKHIKTFQSFKSMNDLITDMFDVDWRYLIEGDVIDMDTIVVLDEFSSIALSINADSLRPQIKREREYIKKDKDKWLLSLKPMSVFYNKYIPEYYVDKNIKYIVIKKSGTPIVAYSNIDILIKHFNLTNGMFSIIQIRQMRNKVEYESLPESVKEQIPVSDKEQIKNKKMTIFSE